MIKREMYLSQIRPFIDQTELIKVIVGVRRSGKSIMLELIKDELVSKGISRDNMISVNFEDMTYSSLTNAVSLHTYLKERIDSVQGRTYIFLDEIQEVSDWEKCVNSLRVNSDADIYITGSNAKMLSGEYATLLSGRYVEFSVYPFSFSEYCEARNAGDERKSTAEYFAEYVKFGGLPFLATAPFDEAAKMQYLKDIYASVVIKDIVKRNNLRDVDLLERIIAYAVSNIGRTFSANSISAYLKNERRAVSVDTIINYLAACEKAFLFYKINRMDLSGKEILKINEKYYLADHGLRQALFGSNMRDVELILENIVCMELLRRGYKVNIGKNGNREIDFVCDKDGKRIYVQVCYMLASEKTAEREFGAYNEINDNYPKYVLSMDEFDMSRDGIIHMNIRNFLMKNDI
ncbi:MAG: ATP-binding protein [Clostridia bacterium]|nr:ATP-binding protein [Clostridia bacterium]